MLEKFERFCYAFVDFTKALLHLSGAVTLVYASIHLHHLLTLTKFAEDFLKLYQ